MLIAMLLRSSFANKFPLFLLTAANRGISCQQLHAAFAIPSLAILSIFRSSEAGSGDALSNAPLPVADRLKQKLSSAVLYLCKMFFQIFLHCDGYPYEKMRVNDENHF